MQTRSPMALAVGLMSFLLGAITVFGQTGWTSGDIGSVTISGSSYVDPSANSISQNSSGNGLWKT